MDGGRPHGRAGVYSPEEQNLRLMAEAPRHYRWIYEQLEPFLRGPRVLEVGAGVGHLTRYILQGGYQVTCTDVNEKNLAVLRTCRPTVRAVLDDIASTRLQEVFDSMCRTAVGSWP
ncbi:hypothetical protein HRbin11_02338 [bacterium HR11]|nr:hypothetical protein HRbin11_02338 [bacterium HR11]